MNILLTSAGRRAYLVEYFKQALRGRGKVIAANCSSCPAFYSADEWVIVPQIYDPEYIPFLQDFCDKKKISAIIPLFDIDIPVLAKHREKFSAQGVRVVVPSIEVANACNDKLGTATLLSKMGINTPRTAETFTNAMELIQAGELSFPLIVKPRWGMGSIGVHKVKSAEALKAACVLIEEEIRESYLHFETSRGTGAHYLIQELLRGDEYGLDVICDLDYGYLMTSVKKKMGMRAGETDSAMTVDSDLLRDLGKRLSTILPHPGVMDVDVFLCGDEPVVLEANARFGGGYPFTHASGIDVPSMIVDWLFGKTVEEKRLRQRFGCFAYKDITMKVRNDITGE